MRYLDFLIIKTTFFLDLGHATERNKVFQEIAHLPKQFKMSFKIKPAGSLIPALSSVIRVGIGGDKDAYGDRITSVFFAENSTQMIVSSSINGNPDYTE